MDKETHEILTDAVSQIVLKSDGSILINNTFKTIELKADGTLLVRPAP